MGWFGKKRSRTTKFIGDIRENIARGVAKGIQKVQNKWAGWMNKQVAKLSIKSQKVVFVLWGAIMFSACIYTIVNSLKDDPPKRNASGQMKLPRVRLQQPASRSIEVSDRMYQRLQAFKNKMDSLGNTHQGKVSRDSLLKIRPGLMDSIDMVERIYKNN